MDGHTHGWSRCLPIMKAIPHYQDVNMRSSKNFNILCDGITHGRKVGRTDGQPGYIMPPAPKGGGIIMVYKIKFQK